MEDLKFNTLSTKDMIANGLLATIKSTCECFVEMIAESKGWSDSEIKDVMKLFDSFVDSEKMVTQMEVLKIVEEKVKATAVNEITADKVSTITTTSSSIKSSNDDEDDIILNESIITTTESSHVVHDPFNDQDDLTVFDTLESSSRVCAKLSKLEVKEKHSPVSSPRAPRSVEKPSSPAKRDNDQGELVNKSPVKKGKELCIAQNKKTGKPCTFPRKNGEYCGIHSKSK